MDNVRLQFFSRLIDEFAKDCDTWAIGNGFWDFSNIPDNILQRCYELCIDQWEVSQIAESMRKGVDYISILSGTKWPENPSRKTLELVCKVLLIHSEVSELFHAVVFQNMDDHLPSHTGTSAEGADVTIRLFSLISHMEQSIGSAIAEKQKYNETRPFRNGKLF